MLSTVRTNVINQIDGGLSHYIRYMLETFVFNPAKNHLERFGITLDIRGVHVRLRALIGLVIGDVPALSELTLCKGHSGFKCCILCKNVLLAAHASANDLASGYAITHTCLDCSKFVLHTDGSIQNMMCKLRVESERMTTDDFAQLQLVYGFNYNPFSFLLSDCYSITVASSLMWDWMHNLCEGGLVDKEIGLCVATLKRARAPTTFATISRFVKLFKLPKHLPRIDKLFDASSCAKYLRNEALSCSATQVLTLCPVLAVYFSTFGVSQGYCLDHVHCLLALFHVVSLLDAVRLGIVSPDALAIAVKRHGDLYVQCYGERLVRPKHHYTQHLPDMFRRWGILLSCWVHERHHRLLIRWTENRRNSCSRTSTTIHDNCSQRNAKTRPPLRPPPPALQQ